MGSILGLAGRLTMAEGRRMMPGGVLMSQKRVSDKLAPLVRLTSD
ncbi:hypothetical protein RISK_002821 [Rhodopirellula islandica]|uniref:Uncharacterized protein n=1 Tax=Rhodopirellula islandica TaxID=595434 RepID=A0A0J1EHN3_RHOIS|nr:hypothetical protein RISK_002821 [Rhodopirellula islandica]